MEVILIRHGKTKGNLEKRYIGKTDQALCPKGIEEIVVGKENGSYATVDKVFSSPMIRCKETAKLIYPNKEIVIVDDFRECNFGVFENKNYMDLKENQQYQVWIDSNGRLPFPKGEDMESFQRRCVAAFLELMEKLGKSKDKPRALACIVHGGTIMSIMSQLCQKESKKDYYDYMVENGEGYICKWKDNGLEYRKKIKRNSF